MGDHSKIKRGSNKGFGLVFATVFAVVAALPLLSGGSLRLWAVALAVLLAGLALVRADLLEPLNEAWFKLGLLIGKVVSPVVMAVIYVVAVIPTGLVLRLFKHDPLERGFDREAATYWSVRTDDNPTGSMKNQF